jgi:hypothetical protein
MKKVIILLSLVVLFLIGCNSETVVDNDKIIENDNVDETQTIENEDLCTEGWKCSGEYHKRYLYANCTNSKLIECRLGCENSECRKGQVCDSGFKCIDENRRGYQLESCGWIKKEDCDFACEDGKCIPKPENYTEPIEEEVIVEEPVESLDIMVFGQKYTVTVDGVNHEISIQIMDSIQATLVIDEEASDELGEGDSYSYNGVTINVELIFYQNYPGGKQEVHYSLG